jgi:hypothetical protein
VAAFGRIAFGIGPFGAYAPTGTGVTQVTSFTGLSGLKFGPAGGLGKVDSENILTLTALREVLFSGNAVSSSCARLPSNNLGGAKNKVLVNGFGIYTRCFCCWGTPCLDTGWLVCCKGHLSAGTTSSFCRRVGHFTDYFASKLVGDNDGHSRHGFAGMGVGGR